MCRMTASVFVHRTVSASQGRVGWLVRCRGVMVPVRCGDVVDMWFVSVGSYVALSFCYWG